MPLLSTLRGLHVVSPGMSRKVFSPQMAPVKPGEIEDDPYTHDKIRDPVEPLSLPLALTAALAACGSDEPSGGTGPDRTASPPTETPATPARTPSTPGAGDAPTATDTPVPTATTAPPAASGSAETDREALVALYNATDGENWTFSDNWLSDAPLGEWAGVYTDDDGRRYMADLHRQRLERGDTGGVGQSLQPDTTVARREPVEWRDTGGTGQPLRPETAVPLRQPR